MKENQQPLQTFNDKPQWVNTSSTFEFALASCAHVLLHFQEMFLFLVLKARSKNFASDKQAAHNIQFCHNAAGSPDFIIISSLTSSSDCNNFTPLSAQKLKDFLTAVLPSLLFNDCTFLYVFIPVFFSHADTHSCFKGLYFFPCSCWSAPPPHPKPPALNCSGFGFIMVHVNVFVSAYIMFCFFFGLFGSFFFFCTSEHC